MHASGRARFFKNRGAVVGSAIVLAILLFALLGPVLSGQDPLASDFLRGMTPAHTPVGPGAAHLLGVDRLYRDELARLAVGARLSLLIAVVATAIACFLGALVGIIAGYFEGSPGPTVPWAAVAALLAASGLFAMGRLHAAEVALVVAACLATKSPLAGLAFAVALLVARGVPDAAGAVGAAGLSWIGKRTPWVLRGGPRLGADWALMRLVDVGLAFPFLLLVMAIGAALDRTSATTIFVILGLTGWLGAARVLRAKTMQVRSLDFVTAAKALGQSTPAILVRHVLPNVAGPLIVIATISVAQMIVAEAVLSYLGVGVAPPTPTWGHMLFDGQDYYLAAPWLILAPGIAILLSVFGFNLLGEGLRDALDPQTD